jgi:DDE_Tnp_1-associated
MTAVEARACRPIIPDIDPAEPDPAVRCRPTPGSRTPHLLACLAAIPDPRARAGRRHPLVAILALAAAVVLAGAGSFAAIAEWAADAPQPVQAALGAATTR